MNCSAAILTQWRREDPDRLLQAALSQAERLAEMAPQAEALRAQNAWLHQQVEVKTKRIAELQAALEAAQRAAHRQAAPFRIEAQKRAAAPKRPGRKHGHPGAFRHKPEQTDEHIEVQLCSCPHCGGAQFKDQHAIEQLIEDIPPVRPHVTRLTTTPLRSNRNATPIIIKPFAKLKPFTLTRARASYANWRQCCATASHSNSTKLSLTWKPSVICVKASNTKPFYCWSLPAANLTKKPCANGSINSAIISSPFWIMMALMPPTTWPNANCAQR